VSRRGRALTSLLAVLALALSAAGAGAATPRADFADVEDEIMCDTCNVALHIAESPRADQLRDEIRDLIAAGRTKEQIKTQLADQYGPNILAEPDKDGLGILAYVLPLAFAAGLIALLAFLLPRWRRRAGEPAAAPEATAGGAVASDQDQRRLDDELARYGA
jgi:cytochrome c-type biogenesis protein CcmH